MTSTLGKIAEPRETRAMGSEGELLFVYGTLRPGVEHELQELLRQHARLVGNATFRGRLYDLGEYPGAVESSDDQDVVTGNVYRILNGALVWPTLDAYEEYFPADRDAEFVRKQMPIQFRDSERAVAWIYAYNRDTANLKRILSGDYLQALGMAAD